MYVTKLPRFVVAVTVIASSSSLFCRHRHLVLASSSSLAFSISSFAFPPTFHSSSWKLLPSQRQRQQQLEQQQQLRLPPFADARRYYHATMMLHLNRVLFHISEIDIANNNNINYEEEDDGKKLPSSSKMDTTMNYIAKVTLSRDDYRTIHIAKILKLQNGDTLRVGVVRHRPRNHHHHNDHNDHSITSASTTSTNIDNNNYNNNNDNNNTLAGLRTDNATIVWIPEGKRKVGAPTKNGDPPGSLCITIPHPPPPITTSSSSTSSSTSLTTSIMNQIITAVDDYDNDKENVAPTIPNNDKSASTNSTTTINYKDNDDVPRVSLLLALPRPLQLQRILPMVSQLGVEHILLTNANKVPKDYFGCRILRNSNNNNNDNSSNDNDNIAIQNLLIEGLSICGNDVTLPSVTVTKKLHTLLEQDGLLDQMFPRTLYARVIAHPTRLSLIDDDGASNNSISSSNDDDGISSDVERIPIVTTTRRRMTDVVFPTSNSQQQQQSKRMLVAVGPEGGWEESYELTMFANAGFQQVSLGARVLRSDVAVISLLALANEVCYS